MRKALILVGASAVGKTSVAMRMLEMTGKFELIRSATTRAPRNDAHDDEYIYLTREEFIERINTGMMLEHMIYGSNMYGTPKSEVDRVFDEGKIPLLILDICGVKTLKSMELDFSPCAFYIYEDINVIENRLYARELSENPTAEKLAVFLARKEANIRDYMLLPEIVGLFDAFLRNDDIEKCANLALSLFDGFLIGKEPNREENLRTAEALMQSAKAKAEN